MKKHIDFLLVILLLFFTQTFFFVKKINAQSNNPDKTFEQAKEKYNQGNYKGAIAEFSIANEMYGGSVECVFMVVKCKIALDDLEGALQECNTLIELEKNNASFYNNRGNIKDQLNRPDEAIPDYDKAISLKPDYVNAHYNRGIAYYNLQDFEKSKKDFEFVTKASPKDGESWYGLGLVLQKLKAKEEACKAFKTAKELAMPEAEKAWEEFCK